jgi:prophage tail gpP-like protein
MPPRTDASPWTVQDQAEWRRRTQIALGSERTYEVIDWRAGISNELWRPNTLVQVCDQFTLINEDRLIAGVTYLEGEDGARTRLRVVLPDLFDLTGDIDDSNRAGRRRAAHTHAIDATSSRYR